MRCLVLSKCRGMKKLESRKILFAASECAPLVKSGGLGDVVAGLAKELIRAGHDVRIVIPFYGLIDRDRYPAEYTSSSCVHMGTLEAWVGIHETRLDGLVPVWLMDHQATFGRPGIYDEKGYEYHDNPYRYALFSKACLQVCKDSGWIPDVIHVHDWQTAPVTAYLKTWDRILSPLSTTASVLTIHNIGYQGVYPADVLRFMGLGDECFKPDIFEDHGRVNFLKGGVWFADAINTVSPTHADEILSPEGGKGLAPYLNRRREDVCGILNGADYSQWDPSKDPFIAGLYDPQAMELSLIHI